MTQPRLLAIFAHPDDESFGSGGMLARYADEGVEVHVCIVTDGAAGSYDEDVVPVEQRAALAEIRRQELQCASQKLGAQLHFLGYRDSGMEGSPDNQHPDSLYQADLDAITQQILRVIEEVRPHIVVTHDPTGAYFHPDHIKVNHAVLRAWQTLDGASGQDGAKDMWRPFRLYYSVIPRSQLKWLLLTLRLMRKDPRRYGRNQDVDLTRVGVPDDQIHVHLNIRPYLESKRQASACHESQGGAGGPRVPAFLARWLQGYEYYVQAYPPEAAPHDDLFAALTLDDT